MAILINTLLPVFGIIFGGYLCGRYGLFTDKHADGLHRFVYYMAFPCLIFSMVASTPSHEIFNWNFICLWTSSGLIIYALTAVISFLCFESQLGEIAMRCMNASCSNSAFIGTPLCLALFGKGAIVPAVLATLTVIVVGIPITTILLEIDRNTEVDRMRIARDILLFLARNPLIIALVMGAVVAFTSGALPAPIKSSADLLGAAAIPSALFAMGISITGRSLQQSLPEVSTLSLIKLVLHPTLTWLLIRYVFPLETQWITVAIVLAALPTAPTCIVIAQRYQTYVQQTSAMLVIATLASILTLSALLTWSRLPISQSFDRENSYVAPGGISPARHYQAYSGADDRSPSTTIRGR